MRSETTRREILRRTLALGMVLSVEGGTSPRARANALRVGEAAPPAVLTTLDGTRISSAELLGQVVIVTFWATWCAPCRAELPLLSDYAAQHRERGLAVLGFSLDGPEALTKVATTAVELRFPVGLLAQSSAPGYGRIWRIPVNFTIDRAGRLIDDGWKEKDPTWTAERLDRLVTPLLGAPTTTPHGGETSI